MSSSAPSSAPSSRGRAKVAGEASVKAEGEAAARAKTTGRSRKPAAKSSAKAAGLPMVTLDRTGLKPLRFKGVAACRTGATGQPPNHQPDHPPTQRQGREDSQDEITLWLRQDGKLAVSVRIAGRQEAAVVRDLSEAQDWVETLCRAGIPDEADDGDALALLDCLDRRTLAALRSERIGRIAAHALADWSEALATQPQTATKTAAKPPAKRRAKAAPAPDTTATTHAEGGQP